MPLVAPRLNRSSSRSLSALLLGPLLAMSALLPAVLCAEDWPQWRGPEGNGVSREVDLPLAWSEDSGIAWKCKLPEWGDSTPAICGRAVFVTTAADDGQRLLLLKIDRATGRIEWTRQVGSGSTLRGAPGTYRGHQKFHDNHNLATPSPVSDGQLVVVHFGNGDLAAYDFAGKELWKRNLQDDHGEYTIWWGHANSPVLHGDLVISTCIQDSCSDVQDKPAESYVVAHDKQTGELRWKTLRMTPAVGEPCDAYTTPIFRQSGGRTEMIVMGGQLLDAYDPASGSRLWEMAGLQGNRVIPSPVAADGMIFAIQGMRMPLLAIRPGGDGRRSADDVVWEFGQGTSDSPSPLVSGDLLWMLNNQGIVVCFDARTGKVHWKQRLPGEYRASPVWADGRVYFLNMQGLATVVRASAKFERLAENQLDDKTIASPAVSDGKIFIRGNDGLYCIGK